ncbi:MAG: hypothetical protein CMH56_01870 [Myxococcales bacterium]|nr:hypothetical protein [Myxococcales bacterium]
MITLFQTLGIEPAHFFKAAFEVSCISFFLICFAHSWMFNGSHRTLREFSAGFFLTFACESLGVLSGAYVYPGFYLYLFVVPVANPASWVALVYVIIGFSNRLVYGRRALDANFILPSNRLLQTVLLMAALDASLALGIDLVMDPLATIFNWWIWVPLGEGVNSVVTGVVEPYNFKHWTFLTTPETPVYQFFSGFFVDGNRYPSRVLGIPLINFISWFVFVFVFASQCRGVESQRHWSEAKKTLVLWMVVLVDVPVLVMTLIPPNL